MKEKYSREVRGNSLLPVSRLVVILRRGLLGFSVKLILKRSWLAGKLIS